MHIFRFLLGGLTALLLAIIVSMLFPISTETTDMEPSVDAMTLAVEQDKSTPDPMPAPEDDAKAPVDVVPAVFDPRKIKLDELQVMRQNALELEKTSQANRARAVLERYTRIREAALIDTADLDFSEDQRPDAMALRLRCADGDQNGCVDLATLYLNGSGVYSDKPLATALYSIACESGSAAGCAGLEAAEEWYPPHDQLNGIPALTLESLNAERNAQRALIGTLALALDDDLKDFMPHYYGRVQRAKRGCRADISADCIDLGRYIWGEYSGGEAHGILYDTPDLIAARALYLKACELDDADGCLIYADAHNGMGEDDDTTVYLPYYELACDMGQGASCSQLAFQHEWGQYIPEDETKAAELYARACDLGDNYGCQNLIGLYDIEDEILRVSYNMRACVHGNGQSCTFLADDFKTGRDAFETSPDVARALLTYGCEDENEDSCSALARLDG